MPHMTISNMGIIDPTHENNYKIMNDLLKGYTDYFFYNFDRFIEPLLANHGKLIQKFV